MSITEEVRQLREENAELRQKLAAVETQLASALERIAELSAQIKQGQEPPGFVKPKRQKAAGEGHPKRKKRAAEYNGSRRRAKPTRIERHALEQCPECEYRLRGESIDYTREVIEIPPPQAVEIIEHQVIKRWCPHCEKWRSPGLDLQGQVVGQGRMGVRIVSLVAYLRTTLRLTFRQIQAYLLTLHHLEVSTGEVVKLCHGVRRQMKGQTEKLLNEVLAQPVVHADETGWRENGDNGYIWTLATDGPQAIRYYQYAHSRSHFVLQHLLGTKFQGVLVSDFYSAYNLIPGRHQRCWVHLLRDLHKLKEEHATKPEVIEWAQGVRQLYDEACAWLHTQVAPTAEERHQQAQTFSERADALGLRYASTSDHPCCVLAKRLLRHQDELFQFVLVPGLPADNNLAERSIRPLVVVRKISGGSRSENGSHTRMALASLFGTWTARQLNPFLTCLTILQSPPHAASP